MLVLCPRVCVYVCVCVSVCGVCACNYKVNLKVHNCMYMHHIKRVLLMSAVKVCTCVELMLHACNMHTVCSEDIARVHV